MKFFKRGAGAANTRLGNRKHSSFEGDEAPVNPLLKEIRHNPLLWLLAFVPVLFAAQNIKPDAHTLLFVLSVLAIVPLAGLLSHATESVAAKTGDTVGGLLNATLGNLTELVIALRCTPGNIPW
jgi:Ca2+/H+ antiporter